MWWRGGSFWFEHTAMQVVTAGESVAKAAHHIMSNQHICSSVKCVAKLVRPIIPCSSNACPDACVWLTQKAQGRVWVGALTGVTLAGT